MEEALLAGAWRKWQQTGEALDETEEAEDFQSVGMRCRESLIAMVKTLAKVEMVAPGEVAPKRADVPAWSERIADHIAYGSSAECVRHYLKTIAKSGWQLATWVTHASNATRADAILTLEATQHILATFGTAMFRQGHGIPDQCPSCGSYQIGLRRYPDDAEAEAVPGCRACGWVRREET